MNFSLADISNLLRRAADWQRVNWGHDDRTMTLAIAIGDSLTGAMKLTEENKIFLKYGALLHDIGRIGIDSELIQKQVFTAADRAAMESHAQFGYNLVADILPPEIALTILHHHENWDGTGYPKGLRGEQIPLFARIVRIADYWDALRNNRPYRDALTPENSLHIMKLEANHFDPLIFAEFQTIIQNGGNW